jgi:hypothetical protein
METIHHLPKTEQQHFTQCPICKTFFDMRTPLKVLRHEHYRPRIPVVHFTYAVKEKNVLLYYKNEQPILLN